MNLAQDTPNSRVHMRQTVGRAQRISIVGLYHYIFSSVCVCVCFFPFYSGRQDCWMYQPGVTKEEGHTGFLIHLPSAVLAIIFLARRIQPFFSLVDREVEFCVLTI